MNERTRLKQTSDEEAQYEYEEEEFKFSNQAKITMGLFIILMLGFFTILLPNYYIPKSITLQPIIKVKDLQVSLTPDKHKLLKERLILIGDVHAHLKEFKKLLKKAEYNKKVDHVIVLGDFISKGPDNLPLLNYLIENDIDCILGNHEFSILQNYATFHGLNQPNFEKDPQKEGEKVVGPHATLKYPEIVIKEEIGYENSNENIVNAHVSLNNPKVVEVISTKDSGDFSNGKLFKDNKITKKDSFNNDPDFLLAKKLQPNHVKYINQCSIMKTLGVVPNGNGVAVHAGLVPNRPLEQQNPFDNLFMRNLIAPFYNETCEDYDVPNSRSWSKVYNEINDDDTVVYYGHAASRGLDIKKFTKGLDSGCNKGGQLSAMVIRRKGKKLVEEVVSVNC
ncbi:unnamed protein product [Candida verbasci]|uniref:Calcineurin-like phosphoesterase domain-containing protein n=1 Tax=Candida verbasci TaxID=1227364 RepID=A0A9W4U1I9_9ASCO|nr:unnamed protein product [Candida verbasci]